MDKISMIVISIATFLNAIITIGNFVGKVKKPVDEAIDNRFKEALEPVNEKLEIVNQDIRRLDKNQCMNYLVNFIEDSKNGIPKD